jgi:uroporphyrinogen decarboxylase
MNSREKFLSVMRMPPGRHSPEAQVPKVEFGYWAGVLRRWFREGLEQREPVLADIPDGEAVMANRNITARGLEKAGDLNVQPVFGLDQYLTKFPVDYSPRFPRKVLEQTAEYVVYRDSFGVTNKNDPGMRSLPLELDNPVKDRRSWEEYKPHYAESTIPDRLPPDWDRIAARLRERDFPIRLGGTNGGFLGFPRQIMGLTGYLLALYDDPALIHDICDTFLRFLQAYYDRIIRDVRVDCLLIWEDMAGKQGSLISPEHFREFLAPCYRAMVGFARESGVDVVLTDSDGYVEELIPLIVETGVTGMYPFERAAGNNLLRIREAFPAFQILGGFDKRVLFEGSTPAAIEAELAVTEAMLRQGRFIPHVDHFVSQDCTWENFSYYRRRLNEIIDRRNL